MNSIYGNTIAPGGIGDLYFYDRTYSRDDFATDSMRQAKAQSDGVFIGRYVLVESIGENDGHNEAWRKVMKNGVYDYERVAILDAATTQISIGDEKNYGAEYFNPSSVFNGNIAGSSEYSISLGEGGYDANGKYSIPLNFNLPIFGEAVGQVFNVLYGSNNRSNNVTFASYKKNLDKIQAGGKTLSEDGLYQVLSGIEWDKLNSGQAQWAATYLELTNAPADNERISSEYLRTDGGNSMSNAISWSNGGDINSIQENNVSVLTLSARDRDGKVSIKNTTEVAGTITSTATGTLASDNQAVLYNHVKTLVSNNGMPYVLNKNQYTKDLNGAISLDDENLNSLPAGTIFFIPVDT